MWRDGKFVVPDEYKDKPAADVAKYYDEHYGERYKDYDDLKTRAADAENWGKLGKREEIEGRLKIYDNVAQALRAGKVIVADDKGTLYARDPKDLTPAERRTVVADPNKPPENT